MEDKERINNDLARDIAHAVKGIRYGYVQVIIQDSKVVQIDRTEKIRLANKPEQREEGL